MTTLSLTVSPELLTQLKSRVDDYLAGRIVTKPSKHMPINARQNPSDVKVHVRMPPLYLQALEGIATMHLAFGGRQPSRSVVVRRAIEAYMEGLLKAVNDPVKMLDESRKLARHARGAAA